MRADLEQLEKKLRQLAAERRRSRRARQDGRRARPLAQPGRRTRAEAVAAADPPTAAAGCQCTNRSLGSADGDARRGAASGFAPAIAHRALYADGSCGDGGPSAAPAAGNPLRRRFAESAAPAVAYRRRFGAGHGCISGPDCGTPVVAASTAPAVSNSAAGRYAPPSQFRRNRLRRGPATGGRRGSGAGAPQRPAARRRSAVAPWRAGAVRAGAGLGRGRRAASLRAIRHAHRRGRPVHPGAARRRPGAR